MAGPLKKKSFLNLIKRERMDFSPAMQLDTRSLSMDQAQVVPFYTSAPSPDRHNIINISINERVVHPSSGDHKVPQSINIYV